MKIKKLLVILSILVVMLSLAGCENKEVDKPFMYSDANIVIATMQIFENYNGIPEVNYDLYIDDGTEIDKAALKGIKQAKTSDKVGNFESYSNYIEYGVTPNKEIYDISYDSKYVTVTLTNHADNRDVEIVVKYKENTDYTKQLNEYLAMKNAIIEQFNSNNDISFEQYLAEQGLSSYEELIDSTLANQGLYSFTPDEIVVNAVYSKTEMIKQAGMNTILGMGTVFCVLIFISFIISLFKFLPALFSKKAKVPEAKKPVAVAKPVDNVDEDLLDDEELVNDEELVAVIMAAIQASIEDNEDVCLDSNDTLIVRSIRRVKNKR